MNDKDLKEFHQGFRKGCKHQFVWRISPHLPAATPENEGKIFRPQDFKYHQLTEDKQIEFQSQGYILSCDDKCPESIDKSLEN